MIELVYQSLAGELADNDQAVLDAWLNASSHRRQWYNDLQQTDLLANALSQQDPGHVQTVILNIHEQLRALTGLATPLPMITAPVAHRIHFLRTAWFKAAVIIVIILTALAIYYAANRPLSGLLIVQQHQPAADILPGSNKAILTLSNGEKVELNNATSETIRDGNLSIVNNNGQLSYKNAGVAAVNTMSTPKGGQYQLTLADGTKVWLNAASSITYPTAFTGKTREVDITGEVYFEVTKNQNKPFYVNTGREIISVLGTRFNVNSYSDEPFMKTSLIEGAVRVGNLLLQPGQAYLDGRVVTTDIEQDIAWKNGAFNFKDMDLKAAFRLLARWYNVDIKYAGEVPRKRIRGKMGRDLTLPEVLKTLTELGIRTKIEGMTLIVLPD